MDEAFCKKLETASHLQALVLTGDFSYPDIYRKSNTVGHKPIQEVPEEHR